MSSLKTPQNEKYLSKLGGLILTWSHYETGINLTIEQIYNNWNGKEIFPTVPRTGLSRKIKFLRRWYNQNPHLEVHEWIPNQLDVLKMSSKIRDTVIHGIMVPNDRVNITESKFFTYSPDPNQEIEMEVNLTSEQLWILSKIFICGAGLWGDFSRFLQGGHYNIDDLNGDIDKHLAFMIPLLNDLGDTQD